MLTHDSITWNTNPASNQSGNGFLSSAYGEASEITAIPSQDVRNVDVATLVGVVPEFDVVRGTSDNQLVAATAQGDCAAFEQLYDRHVRRCFGLALRIVREPSLAEDIVQDVFIKLWSRPTVFSPVRGTFNAWLLTVVRNQALDRLRRAKTSPQMHTVPVHVGHTGSETIVDMLPDDGPTPHEQTLAKETAVAVQHALSQLPDSEYQTITLAYFGGLTQQEIAAKLQQPLGTVKTRTRSALHRLHRLLDAEPALLD